VQPLEGFAVPSVRGFHGFQFHPTVGASEACPS
jgi:hypothetical protein